MSDRHRWTMEGNRLRWDVRTSNPGEAVSRSLVGSTPTLFRQRGGRDARGACVQRTNNGARQETAARGAKKCGLNAWAEPELQRGFVINPTWIGCIRSVRSSAAKFDSRSERSCEAFTTILQAARCRPGYSRSYGDWREANRRRVLQPPLTRNIIRGTAAGSAAKNRPCRILTR